MAKPRRKGPNAWAAHFEGAWPPGVPDGVWAPFVSAGLILLAGGLGLIAGNLIWLFPSLGPTAFLQTEDPERPSARLYNVIVGHLIGIATGYLAVFALGIAYEPSVFALGQLTLPRVAAGVIAILLNQGIGLLANASHPPAAATTLLVSLGAFRPTVIDALSIVAGVVIVGVVGEGFRRLRLGGNLKSDSAK